MIHTRAEAKKRSQGEENPANEGNEKENFPLIKRASEQVYRAADGWVGSSCWVDKIEFVAFNFDP